MPRKQKKFPGTSLDNKIPKNADPITAKATSLSELCRFFDLDEKLLLSDKNSPWRVLAEKMAGHLIPGFQINQSGNKRVTGGNTDFSIFQEYSCLIDFGSYSSEEAMATLSKNHKLTAGQVKAAIARGRRMQNDNIDALYNPYSAEPLPKSFSEKAKDGWEKKNRKSEHNKI